MQSFIDIEYALARWGESPVLVATGVLMGLVFGLAAQRSRLCTRAAVVEFCEGHAGGRVAVWWLTLAVALVGTQWLVFSGHLLPGKTRFMDSVGSISGALLGGLFFGAGMVLARGCASRLLVLGASGNLRAWVTGLVFAITVQASISGGLAPARRWISGIWLVDAGADRNLLSIAGVGPSWGLALAVVMLVAALVFALRRQLSPWLVLGALACGLAVTGGWALTQAVARVSFEVVPILSLSYSNASAEWLTRLLGTGGVPAPGFEAGLLPGTFLGALLGSVFAREFKLEGFQIEHSLGRYLTGAVLMGFGAVLALGCTVGAGMSGSAIFSLTAWLTLLTIWAGAGLMWRLHQALGWRV